MLAHRPGNNLTFGRAAHPSAAALVQALANALEAGRALAGLGLHVAPTLYLAGLAPEELTALTRVRDLERSLARSLTRLAWQRRYLMAGPIEVSLWAQPGVTHGHPEITCAFREPEALALSEALMRRSRTGRRTAADHLPSRVGRSCGGPLPSRRN